MLGLEAEIIRVWKWQRWSACGTTYAATSILWIVVDVRY